MPGSSPAHVVRTFLAARDGGDPDAAVRVVHPAAVWERPHTGELCGRPAIRSALAHVSREEDGFHARVGPLHEHGRLVIAAVQEEEPEATWPVRPVRALVFRVEDELITNVTIVVDDGPASGKPAAAGALSRHGPFTES